LTPQINCAELALILYSGFQLKPLKAKPNEALKCWPMRLVDSKKRKKKNEEKT